MIKSIIKRVIIGVSIALILGAIGSCEVKAVSRDVTYTSFKYVKNDFNNESVYVPSANSFSLGNYDFARFSGIFFESSYNYLRGTITTDDNTPFGTYDYFSFVVLSSDVQITSVQFYNLNALICTVTPTSLLTLNTNDTRNYASVVECNTAGSNSSIYSSGMYVYLSSPGDTSYNVALSKKIHFSNDPITSKLSAISSQINTTNSNLDDIIEELGDTNSALSIIATRLQTIQSKIESGNVTIKNAVNNTTNAVTNMDNTIKDDDTSNVNTDAINGASGNIASSQPISNIILLPVTLFTNVLNNVDGSCHSYSFGSLYGTDLTMPCINLNNILGTSLYTIIDVLISGIFAYYMSRKFVEVYNRLSELKSKDRSDLD